MNYQYNYRSILGLNLDVLSFMTFLIILLLINIIGKYFPIIIAIPICFVLPFVLSSIWGNKKSIFEKNNKLIIKYNGTLLNNSRSAILPEYIPIYKILIYETGIEIRVLFTIMFLPYEEIYKIEKRGSKTWAIKIIIYSKVARIPARIGLEGLKEEIYINMIKYWKLKKNVN